MRKSVLLDTGVLVAFINKREKQHSWAIKQWKQIIPPFFTCEAVITETCFLLQNIYEGENAVMTLIDRQIIKRRQKFEGRRQKVSLLYMVL